MSDPKQDIQVEMEQLFNDPPPDYFELSDLIIEFEHIETVSFSSYSHDLFVFSNHGHRRDWCAKKEIFEEFKKAYKKWRRYRTLLKQKSALSPETQVILT